MFVEEDVAPRYEERKQEQMEHEEENQEEWSDNRLGESPVLFVGEPEINIALRNCVLKIITDF